MNTRALNALAGVICAAQKQGRRTPMGIAQAIDAAQMLQSPETAAELVELRALVAGERDTRPPVSGPVCTEAAARAAGLDIAPGLDELTAMAESIVAAAEGAPTPEVDLARAVPLMATCIERLRDDLKAIADEVARYGIYGGAIPATRALVTRASELVTENAQLRARIDELVEQRDDALADLASMPDTYVDCRVCGAGHLAGKPCGVCEFNARMAAETGGLS